MEKNLLKDSDYFALKAMSKSQVLQYMKSPVLFWRTTPFNPDCQNWQETDATVFGSLLHLLLLEPDNFHVKYIIHEFGRTRRNKKYLELKESFEESKEFRNIVSPSEVKRAMKMIRAIKENDLCKEVLDGVMTEAPLTWVDDFRDEYDDIYEHTGLQFKSKMDGIKITQKQGKIIVVDYKSTGIFDRVSVDPIVNGFQTQAVCYNEGVRSKFGRDIDEFIFIIQNTAEGLEDMISIVRLGKETIKAGYQEFFSKIKEIKEKLDRVKNGENPSKVFKHQNSNNVIEINAKGGYISFWDAYTQDLYNFPNMTPDEFRQKLKFKPRK